MPLLLLVVGLLKDAWYKYEDEDVNPFDPQEIETCCFGGMALSTSVRVPVYQNVSRIIFFYVW